MRFRLPKRKSVITAVKGLFIATSLTVAAAVLLMIVVTTLTKVVPSTKLVVLRQAPLTMSRPQFEDALKRFASIRGFEPVGFSGGKHLIYYFKPPLSLLSYYGDDMADAALWRDHNDPGGYEQDITALKAVFLPLGFTSIDPSLPSP